MYDTDAERALAAEVLRLAVADLRNGTRQDRVNAMAFLMTNDDRRGGWRWWCRIAGVRPEAFADRVWVQRP